MKFKIRDGSLPQGKPKVYFTGHPDDCAAYFDEISDWILKLCDCTIFYDEDPEHPEDIGNFTADLDSMQLVIITVTGKYIFGDTFAHNTVFGHASKKHIPVLPILMDESLASKFDEKFGDIQYLAPNSKDVTAIGFEDKLDRFLKSVLIGNETAEEVRSEFDGYIFLSYRKKDRRYAQELMRLIHKNDFCRDIAIWYDEFLVPGENFNSAISAALEKSRLFALAVTPSLLENPNYVMTTEYPAACELGKDILPVMLLPTDTNELNRCYKDLPDPVAADTEAVAVTLGKQFESRAKRENDSDPRHNYLIGLAYLGGIDVETDHDRAVSLITNAADADLPEALEKLASMYWTGDGVTRDRAKAIEYQRRLTEVLERVYEAEKRGQDDTTAAEPIEDRPEGENAYINVSKTEQNAFNLANAGLRLGEYLHEFGDMSGAEIVYNKAMRLSGELPKEWASHAWTMDYLMKIVSGLGEVYMEKGELSRARGCFEQSIKLQETLAEALDSPEHLISGYISLGNICTIMGDLTDACKHYGKVIKIFGDLPGMRDTAYGQRASLQCRIGLGEIGKRLGRYAESKSDYEKAVAICEHIAAQPYSTDSDIYVLASVYTGLGELLRSMGDLSGSTGCFMKSLAVFGQLDRKQSSEDPKKSIAGCHMYIGENYCLGKDYSAAAKHLEKSLSLYKQISERDSSLNVMSDMSSIHIRLGDAYEALGDRTRAEGHYGEGLSAALRLSKETDSPRAHRIIADACERLGKICVSTGDLTKAREHFKMCVETNERISANTDLALPRMQLAESYVRLGDVYQASGDVQSALSCYEKSLDRLEPLQDTDIGDILPDLAVTCGKIGGIYKMSGMFSKAAEYYEKGLDTAKKLIGRSDSPLWRLLLGNILAEIGGIYDCIGARTDACGYFEKAAEQLKTEGLADSPEAMNSLCVCYEQLCDIYVKSEDYSSAAIYCDKEIKVVRGIVDQNQTAEMYLKLARTYDKRACLHYLEGDSENAAYRIEDAIRIYEFLAENINTAEMKIHLARYYEKLGGMFKAGEDSSAAVEYYSKSFSIYSELLEQEASESVCVGLGGVSVNLSALYAPNKMMKDYLRIAETAYRILVGMRPDNPEYAQALEDVREQMKRPEMRW